VYNGKTTVTTPNGAVVTYGPICESTGQVPLWRTDRSARALAKVQVGSSEEELRCICKAHLVNLRIWPNAHSIKALTMTLTLNTNPNPNPNPNPNHKLTLSLTLIQP